jgi:hypothetical protein
LADALATYAPPDKPIAFDWPAAVRVDGGLVGGARLGWPDDAAEDEPPAWLVFGSMIRTVAMGEHEPGVRPLSSALDEEGFDELGSGRLVESFARHLMVAVDAWQANEFATVTRTYLHHLTTEKGAVPSLDANGDLLIRWRGQKDPDRHALSAALAVPSWLDPATGGPRT